ncbi:GGDEF domain-containing protein [Wenzhouxiangella sp. XN79A]|uniref:GGDEF domain-containing protein n=1 Tax=Wenzhouxiangella sp. XN79A TaxID=2724193 RepID=UPI00144ABEA8|nr:GGDEF domain-containing protein [Wenzhouxiangella sp. XN79A]NKI33828.1 GGDEF domain-containing protein [Wenzhouxiangella sp. XN79A]
MLLPLPQNMSLPGLGLLLAFTAPVAAMDADRFAERLDRAARLNVSAPWPESQRILDELRVHLDLASHDQRVTYLMLESRNQAMDGQLEASLDTVETLLQLELEPHQRLIAHARAANVGYIARRFETTFRHLNAGMALLADDSLERHAVNLYSVAAYIYALAEEPEDAVIFGRKALAIAQRFGLAREQCAARQRLGFVFKRQRDSTAAAEQYRAAIDECAATGDELLIGTLDYAYGDLLRSIGRHREAEPRLERAIEKMQVHGYREGLSLARLYRARLALARDEADLAERMFRDALVDLTAAGNDEYVAEAHRGLAELALDQERFGDAVDHLRSSMNAREAYLQEVRDRRTAFLQVEFSVAEKERELARLREQQRIAELERQSLAQQSLIRIGLVVGTLLLLLLLLILWVRAVRDRRRFRRLAHRDALTALSNHTRFFELAETTRQLAMAKKRNYTFVLGDIDHFKQVNDRYGHLTGDAVLRKVGAALREQFGDKGIIGRVGGEEFGLALPGPDLATLLTGLEAVRARLRTIRVGEQPIPITMSFGVARPRDGESLTALRERADRRLYAAKQAGRDRVVAEGEG